MGPYLLIIAAFFMTFGGAPMSSFLPEDPLVTVLCTLLALCLAPVPAAVFARWVYRKVFSNTLHLHRRKYALFRSLCGLFILADFAAMIYLLGWPSFVDDSLGLAQLVTYERLVHFPPIALLLVVNHLIKILPFLIMLLMAWVPMYRVDLAVRHGRWGLADYVLFNLRQYVLFLLVPFCVLLLIEDTWIVFPLDLRDRMTASGAIYVINGALIVLALVFLPLLLRFVWKTQPFPAGALRTRLEELLVRTRLRCRQILLWETYGGQMVNACVTGFVHVTRYILITDSLIAALEPDEILAVFAHEIAHVKRHHFIYYAMFALGFIPIALLPVDAVGRLPAGEVFASLWGIVMAALYWGVLFGYISRRLELEADLYAINLLGGVFDFVNALEKLSLASGRARTAGSWRHFSIARRVDLITGTLGNPGAALALHRQVRLAKALCILLAATAVLGMLFFPGLMVKALLS